MESMWPINFFSINWPNIFKAPENGDTFDKKSYNSSMVSAMFLWNLLRLKVHTLTTFWLFCFKSTVVVYERKSIKVCGNDELVVWSIRNTWQEDICLTSLHEKMRWEPLSYVVSVHFFACFSWTNVLKRNLPFGWSIKFTLLYSIKANMARRYGS